jgi:hypothetical protein
VYWNSRALPVPTIEMAEPGMMSLRSGSSRDCGGPAVALKSSPETSWLTIVTGSDNGLNVKPVLRAVSV